MAKIFYQINKTKPPVTAVPGEEIDLEKLNFALRQNFESLNNHDAHVDASSGIHGVVGAVLGGNMRGQHPTDWPQVRDCKDGEFLLWHNVASGWRLYVRSGDVLMYLALTTV